MDNGLNILLLGERTEDLSSLELVLAPVREVTCRTLAISPSSINQVLQRADTHEAGTDVAIIRLGEHPHEILKSLKFLSLKRLRILVIGPQDDISLMRVAMQVGAYDYLGDPVADADLLKALEVIFNDQKRLPKGRLTAVIPVSGGVGGSFIACNLACAMTEKQEKTLLLDMDLMRGSTLQMLDLKATYGLEDVFEQLGGLDLAALEGLLTKHDNGLSILAANHIDLLSGQKPTAGQIMQLLSLLRSYAQEVVVDLPMTPVSVSSQIQQQADAICLVVQQEMVVLRNAIHWMDLSEKEWGIPRSRFTVVVNSYSKGLDIELKDISRILGTKNVVEIPHDYIKVTHSINAGLPIISHAPNTAVSRAIVGLHTHFNPDLHKLSGIRKLAAKLFGNRLG